MLMTMYSHIYVDIGALSWTPIAGDLLEPFLTEAKRRRMLNRVMFGSDQMLWPEAIGLAIDRVNRLEFLTVADKQAIFYDNAARFRGLSAEQIARHYRQSQKGSQHRCKPFQGDWLRGRDLNPRPLGYEPNELPDCSTPRQEDLVYRTWASAATWSAEITSAPRNSRRLGVDRLEMPRRRSKPR